MNNDCPPSQTRQTLIYYVNYTNKRSTIETEKRIEKLITTRTSIFISLVKDHMEDRFKESTRKTDGLLKTNHVNFSYSSVQRALKKDIKVKSWKLTRSQKMCNAKRSACN